MIAIKLHNHVAEAAVAPRRLSKNQPVFIHLPLALSLRSEQVISLDD